MFLNLGQMSCDLVESTSLDDASCLYSLLPLNSCTLGCILGLFLCFGIVLATA